MTQTRTRRTGATDEMRQEALARARSASSLSNIATVIREFSERGIPKDQIEPGQNCLTYAAWQALGRQVRKGEHGVKVSTWVPVGGKDETDDDGETKQVSGYKRPWSAAVFHISQTDAVGTKQ